MSAALQVDQAEIGLITRALNSLGHSKSLAEGEAEIRTEIMFKLGAASMEIIREERDG
jgi:hypothetical protein